MAYALTKWNLGELFPSFESAELQGAFDNVEEEVTSFEGVRNKLFMTNKSGQRFTMRGLRVEVFTYPGRSASIE